MEIYLWLQKHRHEIYTPDEWCDSLGIDLLDQAGWGDREEYNQFYSLSEFLIRAGRSTVRTR